MIPFPGESVRILDGVDLTGGGEAYTLTASLARRAGTMTLDASTVWRAWVYQGDMSYLDEAGLSCEVSWIVEVESGTVTVAAGEMLDPTFADITSTPTPLGSHTVTGPATLVIPSGFTADDVRTGTGSLLLELVGSAGSAVVSQIKLRVWPEGGAVGGWSDPLPSWSTSASFPAGYETPVTVNPNVEDSTQEGSWDATMAQGVADWSTTAPGPHTFTAIGTGPGYLAPGYGGDLSASHASGDGGVTWGTLTSITGAILVLAGDDWRAQYPIDPALTDGVDYVRPPTEVPGEDAAYLVQQVGDGSTGWVNAYAVVGTSSEATPVPAPALGAANLDDLTVTALGAGEYQIDLDATVGAPLATPGPEGSATDSMPVPTAGRFIVVNLAHTAATTPPAWPAPAGVAGSAVGVTAFGAGTPGVDFAPLLTFATLPPYRVWSPTVRPEAILRHWPRNDGRRATSPSRIGQETSWQSGRGGGYA